MDLLKGVLGTLAGPMSAIIDVAGGALGLPPVVQSAIKTVTGVMTGNVMMAIEGGAGLAEELLKNPAAKTEYKPSKDELKAGEGYAKSHLDPKLLDFEDTLKTFQQNFDYLDRVCGQKDGRISLADLKNILQDPQVSPELKKAAQFLVDNPAYFKRMEGAVGPATLFGTNLFGAINDLREDDCFNVRNVRNEQSRLESDFAKYGRPKKAGDTPGKVDTAQPGGGTRPPPGGVRARVPTGETRAPLDPETTKAPKSTEGTKQAPPASHSPSTGKTGFGSSLRDILDDPCMSIEEKMQSILMELTKGVDDELLQTMDEMASAQDRRMGLKSDDKKGLQDADRNIESLNLRLQKLMERRKAMFDLMSNVSAKFNEMAKTAISNLRSA